MQELYGRKVVIMGAGARGKRVLKYCQENHLEVLGFLDNAPNKWGCTIDGIHCYPVDKFKEIGNEIIVVITPEFSEELERQIRNQYPHVMGASAAAALDCVPEQAGYKDFYPFGHPYNLYPDVKTVQEKAGVLYDVDKEILDIDLNLDRQTEVLKRMREVYKNTPDWSKDNQCRAAYGNEFLSPGDMIGLCAMLQILHPKRLIEVGSGWSSAVTLDTNEFLLHNSIECSFIEPYPDRLKGLLKDTDRIELREQGLEDVELSYFDRLKDGDVLFIDSSHVSRPGSDVNYLFFEIFPRLNQGVYVHLHDIFSSFEYPMAWIEKGMVWNELYLLRAFLQNNHQWEIVFFQNLMEKKHPELFLEKWPVELPIHGGSFWMRKI